MITPEDERAEKNEDKASLVAGIVLLALMVVGGMLPKLPNIFVELAFMALGAGAVILSYVAVKGGWKMGTAINITGDMLRPAATVIGATLIATSIAFVFRWDVVAVDGRAWRLDRWTGNAVLCAASKDSQTRGYSLACPYISSR